MQQNIPRERERAGNGLLRKGFIWKIFVDERRFRLCLTRNSDCRISSFEMSHAQTTLINDVPIIALLDRKWFVCDKTVTSKLQPYHC